MDDSPFRTYTHFDLAAELDGLDAVAPSSYRISSDEIDVSTLSTAEQNALLNNLIDQLALTRPEELPREQDLWNNLRTVLKYFENLEDNARSKVADGITSAFSQLVAAIKRDAELVSTGHRTGTMLDDSDDEDGYTPEELRKMYCEPLEMWAFLVNWLLVMADHVANTTSASGSGAGAAAPKSKGRGKKATSGGAGGSSSSPSSFPWSTILLPSLLQVTSNFLQVFPSNLFYPLPTPRESILSAFLRPSLALLDRESNLKANADIKTHVFSITCLSVKRHGQAQTVQPLLLQMLQYHDHLPEAVAQLLTVLRLEYDSPRLAEELLVEIANREFSSGGGGLAMTASMENKVPRSFARFLVAFTETNPRTTFKTIPLLQKLIDSEAYPLRNALVEIFYLLIRDLVLTDDQLPNTASQGGGRDADASVAHADDEARETSEEVRTRQIEGFWKILMERFLDVNSYVRVKVLNICTRLCDLPAKFPAQRTRLLSLTQRALKDKSSSARKAAITLLARLVLTHPYGLMHGGELEERVWRTRVEEIQKKMQELGGSIELPVEEEGEDLEGDEEEEEQDDADETEAADATAKRRPRKSAGRKSITVEQLSAQLSPQDLEMLNRLRLTYRYYADALSFIESLSTSMPTLEELLFSSNKGEALEAMDFFRIAAEYKLPGAEQGMRRMVHLVWMKDNVMVEPTAGGVTGAAGAEERDGGASGPSTAPRSIKGRLVEVYTSLYFSPLDHLSEKENIGLIARNLVQRTQGATLAELTSLEELISTMSGEKLIPLEVVDRLWAVYATPAGKKIQRSQRRGAIIILSMLAASRRQIVQDKIDVLLGVGLAPLGKADPVLAKWTAVALGRVGGSAKKVKGALSDQRTRFPMTHPMFAKLRAAVLSAGLADEAGKEDKKGEWFSLAENCIQVIYELGEQPDRLCGDIVKWFMLQVFGAKEGETRAGRASSPGDEESQQPNVSSSHPALGSSASAFLLAQMVFVVGHVALKQIVYLESVEREYKRRKALQDTIAKGGDDAPAVTNGGRGKKTGKAGAKGKGAGTDKNAAEEAEGDELEQVAGNVEDEVGETMGQVREEELLYGGRSLLALFGPFVVHIASNPKSYTSDHLRRAAVLTLCKFMCVSSKFCERHLALLLHILSTSSDPTTRSNVVIALGDIAVSFGNLVDADSDRLYAGLNDKDLGVKKHTLMVLTHLILNGMIKVKGQLGEMAKCLEDPEARVSNLAKLFFSELAIKENAVYNNLPDIISHLSIGKHAVDEETFERTMRFIFTFIDKEKQAENVIEKLCQRFRLTTAERQWRDIAFCLSLLPFKSERSMKKLIEGLPFYQDKVRDPDVYKRFVEIIQKARGSKVGGGGSGGAGKAGASSTGVSETELQDFEAALEGFHLKGSEEMELERGGQAKAAKAQANAARAATGRGRGRGAARGGAAGRGGARGGGAGGRSRRGRKAESSEEEEEEEEEEEKEEPAAADEDDEEDEAPRAKGRSAAATSGGRRGAAAAPVKATRTARAGAGRRRAIVESSDEEEEADGDDSF
ncbi:ARM repeat-containing protein [Microstroma glucosiphilum]|uniref:ARM repeat-containing protein n=1 Tax=Pseudomicrostroma glucosiphilum TaxID=1684307 RepID=A0A316U9Y1_9BASI|nr:ARM repeat-containing protein [Pseudomicrostroma glucosiphilum]PWN22040.1 ARM repeat-containing protein [Pseudomicrostroma glucosiphilum]